MIQLAFQPKLHHVALQTNCFDDAYNFYCHVLGLSVIKPPFNYKDKRMMAWFDIGGIQIELYSVKKGLIPEPYRDTSVGPTHIALEVEDIYQALSYLKEHDVKVLRDPFLPQSGDPDQPMVAFIEGPDGEEIELRETVK